MSPDANGDEGCIITYQSTTILSLTLCHCDFEALCYAFSFYSYLITHASELLFRNIFPHLQRYTPSSQDVSGNVAVNRDTNMQKDVLPKLQNLQQYSQTHGERQLHNLQTKVPKSTNIRHSPPVFVVPATKTPPFFPHKLAENPCFVPPPSPPSRRERSQWAKIIVPTLTNLSPFLPFSFHSDFVRHLERICRIRLTLVLTLIPSLLPHGEGCMSLAPVPKVMEVSGKFTDITLRYNRDRNMRITCDG
jgi:hypothetical protein